MIFCSKNEAGELAWKLVQKGRKQVTRRLKPVQVGKVVAVQPGRGKKAVCHVRVTSCMTHFEWFDLNAICFYNSPLYERTLEEEAQREGFRSYDGLLAWLGAHKVDLSKTFRIEFELIKDGEAVV